MHAASLSHHRSRARVRLAILVFSTKLPPRQTSTGVPDLTIHEPEAGNCYRIGCMAALD
jgi:hypothetical protein